LCRRASGGLDDSSRQHTSGCRRLVAAEHVGIKIDVPGPDDSSELAVNADGREDIAVVADRCKYAAGLLQPPEIDLVYRTVTKGHAKPVPRERLNVAAAAPAATRRASGSSVAAAVADALPQPRAELHVVR
jgi:hypothetical protein